MEIRNNLRIKALKSYSEMLVSGRSQRARVQKFIEQTKRVTDEQKLKKTENRYKRKLIRSYFTEMKRRRKSSN